MILLTACQIRMARAALQWTVADLAKASGVGERTISRLEQFRGVPKNVQVETLAKIRDAFEREEVHFIEDPVRPGVCYEALRMNVRGLSEAAQRD